MSTEQQTATRRAAIAADMAGSPPHVLAVAESLALQNVKTYISTTDHVRHVDRVRFPRWCRAAITGWHLAIVSITFRCSTVGVAETVRCTFIAHGFSAEAQGCLVTISR